jgi:protein gp37
VSHTKIEWTECTWNPVTGCTEISEGCRHCYARRMAVRLQAMGQPRYRNGFTVALHPEILDAPSRWRRPRFVFVNSMGDLFHEDVPDAYISQVFAAIEATPRHTFQVLTKRSRRLASLARTLPWPANLWMGVTVERVDYAHRIGDLATIEARVKFVSFEPLLGPLAGIHLDGVDWAIAGGESGPGARPLDPEWARALRDQCECESVPFFFKQWGGPRRSKRGRVLDGRTWDQYPSGTMTTTRRRA